MTRKISASPLIYVFLLMVPVYWLVIMSVKTTGEISGQLTFYPHAPTFENYTYIFSDPSWYWGPSSSGGRSSTAPISALV